MELSSYSFIFIFFPFTFIVYYFIPNKYKKIYLLSISLLFTYLISLEGFFVLIFLIIFNYLLSKNLNSKFGLTIGIIFNVLVLAYFKYSNFLISNVNNIFHFNVPLIELIEVIGLSFVIFQNISYLVDVYRSPKNASFVDYALYSFYFPRVINGPILRFKEFEMQINNLQMPKLDKVFAGIKRFSFGMGKVFVLSYITGDIWKNIYASFEISGLSISVAWLGIITYSLYLYFNFSGFIDMSIGISYMFGIILPENFDTPYLSTSISEFWRHWHISLSQWFRDYIYIPLGGNRKGNVYFNIFIVFFVTGVWHGASWNFILWGIYHAILNIIDKILKSKKFYNKIPNIIKTIGTYFLVLLGWVLFASNGARAAFRYIKYMFGLASSSFFQYDIAYFVNSYNVFYIMISLFIAFGFNKKISYDEDSKFGKIIECVLPIIILIISIIFLINNAYCPSLYANF